jgi:hypothetical protein
MRRLPRAAGRARGGGGLGAEAEAHAERPARALDRRLGDQLFAVGKRLIGLYLHSGGASSYGAVGSVAVLLVWVYYSYSSQIVLVGAEFTRLLGDWRTGRIDPQPA